MLCYRRPVLGTKMAKIGWFLEAKQQHMRQEEHSKMHRTQKAQADQEHVSTDPRSTANATFTCVAGLKYA